jgi:hypothetical protein
VLSPAATGWAVNPVTVMAATLLNSSAGQTLLDAMPDSQLSANANDPQHDALLVTDRRIQLCLHLKT